MKKIIIGLSAVLIVMIAMVLYLRNSEDKNYKEKGQKLVVKVEEYRKQHGKLPQSITDLGIKEEMGEGPYYEKIDNAKYEVYFNIGFDNTLTYYSDTEKWKEGR